MKHKTIASYLHVEVGDQETLVSVALPRFLAFPGLAIDLALSPRSALHSCSVLHVPTLIPEHQYLLEFHSRRHGINSVCSFSKTTVDNVEVAHDDTVVVSKSTSSWV